MKAYRRQGKITDGHRNENQWRRHSRDILRIIRSRWTDVAKTLVSVETLLFHARREGCRIHKWSGVDIFFLNSRQSPIANTQTKSQRPKREEQHEHKSVSCFFN